MKLESTEGERQPKRKDYWSECGQVFFHYGTGYGLTQNLITISLGDEADILAAFKTGKLPDNLEPIQHQVLAQILEYRKGVLARAEGVGVRKPSTVRSRPTGTVKRRAAHAKQAPPRKRFPIHKA